MPRSAKDSDEEIDLKLGRKTRAFTEVVSVDSPLRRSTRNRTIAKQNESSPDSPISDTSNASNTQNARVTRRRTITMEKDTGVERHRNLRSRMNSVSSDLNEITETDIATPKKRASSTSSDILNRGINRRSSKRVTRAGSEVSSSPAKRVTRTTRATSVEPDSNSGYKLADRSASELMSTPVKTRRRTLVSPSEATVMEEKAEKLKIAVVALDRNLPNVNVIKEPESRRHSKSKQIDESLSNLNDVDSTSNNSIEENGKDEGSSVEGPHDSPSENVSLNRLEDVKRDALFDDENIFDNENCMLENSEKLFINAKKKIESSVCDESQTLMQSENKNPFKDTSLNPGDLLNKSMEILEDNGNKENLTGNVDSKSTDDKTSNVLLQSPKHVFTINTNENKLANDVCKSPNIETKLTPQRRHSKELAETSDEVPLTGVTNNNDASDNSAIEKMDISVDDEADSNNALESFTSIKAQPGASGSCNVSSDETISSKLCTNPKYDNSIEIVQYTEVVNIDDDSSSQMSSQSNDQSDMVREKESNKENASMKIDISNVEEDVDENVEPEINNTSKNVTKDENVDTNESKNIDEKSNEMNAAGTGSLTDLSNIESQKPSDVPLNTNTLQYVSEHKDTRSLQDTDETNNLHSNTCTLAESSDAHMCSKDSTFTNTNEDSVTNIIKSSKSSTVTETPGESIEEAPEGEQSKKVSVSDSSLTVNKQQLVDKIYSNEIDSDANEGTSIEDQKCMKVNDNDSDSNAASLFQDIPATEWKEKNTDTDKNSVHSMSTERLENESEGECDFVLLDKETWLSAENRKADKDKEAFDYDSDETVLLKTTKNLLKARKEEKLAMDVSEDECTSNVNKHNISSSKNRKSVEQKESKEDSEREIEVTAEDMEEPINVDKNESVVDDNKHSTSKCNLSLRKSLGHKSLSESHEAAAKDVNLSLNKSKLSEDVSKQRKSLNRSMQKSGKSDDSNETRTAMKRTSLNKSNLKELENNSSDTSSDNVIFTSAMKREKNQSSNSSTKKKKKPQRLNINSTDESDKEFGDTKVQDKRDSFTNRQFTRNYSTLASKGSLSDDSKNTYDSDDSQNRTVKLPKFLFGGSSDSDSEGHDGSNQSIDSDIEKEYNLHGKSVSRFSDDDVPGDVCRASETESSDPNDNGSDLDDFVVGDDEVEDEEEKENKNEESENEEGDEIDVEGIDEEMQVEDEVEADEEMQIDKELEKVANQEEEQSENVKENDIERSTNKAIDTSGKERKKSRKSADLSQNLSKKITGSNKKKKNRGTDASLTDRCENENSLSDISISVFKTPEAKGKRVSGEFIVENIDQSLNDSKRKVNKNLQRLRGLMECSTPITNSKQKKIKINMQMSNTSLEETHKRLSTKSLELKEDDNSYKEESKNLTLREEYTSKKLNKMKSNENFLHKSLPSELIELATKTNLSRSMSSNVVELNKTTLVPEIDTPTTKFLKKDKLNESAPVLKLRASLKKLKEMGDVNEQNNQLYDENESPNEQDTETTKGVDVSLKQKLLKLADNLLENDQQKKRKKRKHSIAQVSSTVLLEDYIQKIEDSGATKQNKNIVPVTNTDDNVKTVSSDKKKKKKKKETHNIDVLTEEEPREVGIETKSVSKGKKVHNQGKKKKKTNNIDVPTEEGSSEISIETESVSKDKKVRNEGKKKNKKGNVIGTVSNLANKYEEPKVVKKKKKVLATSPSENVSDEKLLKKKQKKQKLLSEDVVPQDEVASSEKLPKKKKKSRSENNALLREGISDKKILKKKRKLSEYTTQDEHILVEKLPKGKEQLLESEKINAKSTTSIKSKGFTNTSSKSSEGPKVRQREALKVPKRTTDSNETHNEMKSKQRKERTDNNTRKEGKVKIKKLESKNQTTKTNKMDSHRRSIKRCSDELLESLSDVPMKPLKRRKISKLEDQLSSHSIENKKANRMKGSDYVEDDFTALPSTSGSTTSFIVIDHSKIKRKKRTEIPSFKQRMINKKSRQPVSAYLMYLEKQKASGKDKFGRPY